MPPEPDSWADSPLPFIPGIELSAGFYAEVVRPILETAAPGLPYSAALIGYGSDVLGFDTPLSRDHMWGPRLLVFLPVENFTPTSAALRETVRHRLPLRFRGYPTHFSSPDGEGVRIMQASERGPVEPLIEFHTIPGFLRQELGIESIAGLTPAAWLTFPEQRLLAVTAGAVFHDGLGLEDARAGLAYYPDDVWKYLLACQWMRISQEEPFTGRAGQAGDELGSRIIAARLAQDVMRLGFLYERCYAPYSKWFGSAYRRLAVSGEVLPWLEAALAARAWPEREAALGRAVLCMAALHNRTGLTPRLAEEITSFHLRPFRVLHAERFAEALRAAIEDASLRELGLFGSVNQFCTSTDLLESPAGLGRLAVLYHPPVP